MEKYPYFIKRKIGITMFLLIKMEISMILIIILLMKKKRLLSMNFFLIIKNS